MEEIVNGNRGRVGSAMPRSTRRGTKSTKDGTKIFLKEVFFVSSSWLFVTFVFQS